MKNPPYITVIDIPLYAQSIPTFVEDVVRLIQETNHTTNLCISATGAHGIIYAKKNPDFRKLLKCFYVNLPDGMPGVWVGKMKGATDMERCYGPDFFAETIKRTASTDITHFFCGGTDGVAERLKEVCEEEFGNSNIVGTYCPPFLPVENYNFKQIAAEINKTGADIIWIGISTPKQEKFAKKLSKFTNVHFLITVGAAFDFHIGNVRQAPSWMQSMGLEWLFRLLMEPKRLYKRYMEIVPAFLYYSVIDLWNRNSKNKR